MFNGKKIARLSTQLATQTERINALELANANLQSELLRHRGLLKEISLTLPEMTDTLNAIREKLNASNKSVDTGTAERVTPLRPGDGTIPMDKPRKAKEVRRRGVTD